MIRKLDIRYEKRKQIDTVRWDQCISAADNGLVYGYSYYLDIMSKQWDALVAGDYEMVMPLTWNRKFGFHYLYQPAFTPLSGVFGNQVTSSDVDAFLNAIPKRFRLIEISMNHANTFSETHPGTIPRSNYILDLNKPYETLNKNYRENIRRNIRKSEQLGVHFSQNINFSEVITLCSEQMNTVSGLIERDYINLQALCEQLASKNMAKAFGVLSPKGQLLSSAVFFYSHNRAYYIVVGNHPDSRAYGASHYLIDQFIRLHAGSELLLDFEGSDIKNLAFFYESFGSTIETYAALRINRLPAFVRLFKS